MAHGKFDLNVHKRNSKGQIYQVDPYRMVIHEGQQYFERPVGSNEWFYANGEAVPKDALPAGFGKPVQAAKEAPKK